MNQAAEPAPGKPLPPAPQQQSPPSFTRAHAPSPPTSTCTAGPSCPTTRGTAAVCGSSRSSSSASVSERDRSHRRAPQHHTWPCGSTMHACVPSTEEIRGRRQPLLHQRSRGRVEHERPELAIAAIAPAPHRAVAHPRAGAVVADADLLHPRGETGHRDGSRAAVERAPAGHAAVRRDRAARVTTRGDVGGRERAQLLRRIDGLAIPVAELAVRVASPAAHPRARQRAGVLRSDGEPIHVRRHQAGRHAPLHRLGLGELAVAVVAPAEHLAVRAENAGEAVPDTHRTSRWHPGREHRRDGPIEVRLPELQREVPSQQRIRPSESSAQACVYDADNWVTESPSGPLALQRSSTRRTAPHSPTRQSGAGATRRGAPQPIARSESAITAAPERRPSAPAPARRILVLIDAPHPAPCPRARRRRPRSTARSSSDRRRSTRPGHRRADR